MIYNCMITNVSKFKKFLTENMMTESTVTDLVNTYLPRASDNVKTELTIFIDNNIDLESKEIARLLQIIAQI